MDLYGLRTVAFCCCFSFLLMSCGAGDVCLPTWSSFAHQFSIGGTQYHYTSLQDCINYCEYQPDCVAIDFDMDAHPPCWVHTNAGDLVGDNVYNSGADDPITQYVINRTSCTALSTGDCQLNWNRIPGIHSFNGQPYDFWTEYDCFTFCRYTSNCVAADFDIAGNPACWIHTSYDDLAPENTYDDSQTVVQYQMNRTCPTPTSASIQVGGCVGQPIRNGTWCPSGKQINIVAAAYKVHPLCCYSPTDKSDPPDSGALAEFDVFVMGDAAYVSEILACNGRNACSVMSKSFNHSTFINNPYCTQQAYRTNFVSITYACVELGYTNPSTTKSLTSFQFPTESFLTTQATSIRIPGGMCLRTWTRFANRYSIGGIEQHITDLQQCIVTCQLRSDCIAVDFDTTSNPPCWIHTDPNDLVGENVYDTSGDAVAQYVINRTCVTLPTTDCQLNWNRIPEIHSSNGQPYDFWTEYDCFTFCRYTSNCVAADFDIVSNPACWIHTSYDDLAHENTYDDSTTVVQYQMNRTCPTPTSASIQVGGCVGQPIRNGTWCPPGKQINIVAAAYKVHPLCCYSPTDKSDPPDSGALAEFDVFVMGDAAYVSEILACNGRNACSVMSKSFNHSTFINNPYCTQQAYRTNFVSITYACVELGYTNPSTTKSLTSFQFPTESFLTTQAISIRIPGGMCLLTWTRFANRYSIGGIEQHITDLQQCIITCQLRSDCIAVDFDTTSNPPCWIHTDPNDLVGENVYDTSGDAVAQYVINRTCVTLPTTDCQLNWNRIPGIHSSNGQPYDFWTEYDCFTFCRYTSNCVAADFDIVSNPACWIHTSYDDLAHENTYDDSQTVVQYQMNRTCPTPTSANYTIGGCLGQPLRSGNWCLPGEEIHILSASYKIHPLCCNSPDDNSNAPDNPTLVKFNIFDLTDDAYKAEIEACEDKTACSVTSKSYESNFINNVYCPNHIHTTNFVALTYSCVKPGHSDPSTTPSLTSYQFATDNSHSMGGTHQITATTDKSPTAEKVSSLSNNRDALILAGIAIALAIIAILTIIIFAIFLWYRNEKLKQANPHMALNPLYADYPNGTNPPSTISGISASNGHFKGMKTITYPEDDIIAS